MTCKCDPRPLLLALLLVAVLAPAQAGAPDKVREIIIGDMINAEKICNQKIDDPNFVAQVTKDYDLNLSDSMKIAYLACISVSVDAMADHYGRAVIKHGGRR